MNMNGRLNEEEKKYNFEMYSEYSDIFITN